MNFRNALLSILIIEVGVGLLAVINYGASLETLQAVTRFSGRVSLGIFSLIFLFQNHRHINLTSILSDKFYAVFAIAHGIHLIQLLFFVSFSGNELIPVRLAGGFVAYLIIFIMPFAQHRFETNKLSQKQFSRLGLFYLYYIWFIFFMSYLPRVNGSLPHVGGTYFEFVILLAWVSLMLGLKISSVITKSISKRF